MKAFFILSLVLFVTEPCYCHQNNIGIKAFGGGINLSIIIKNPSCTNQIGNNGYPVSNGIIILSASGGTSPYTYDIHVTPPQDNGYFPGLLAGTYNAVVKDASGQTLDTVVTLKNTLNDSFSYSIQVNRLPTSCTNADGSFSVVNTAGGSPPYTFSIDGGVTFVADSTFANLTQGYYQVFIKDVNGCLAEGGTSPVPFYNDYFYCNQCCNLKVLFSGGSSSACTNEGYITLYAAYGTPPYQYSLDGINFKTVTASSNYITNPYEYTYKGLSAGLYHIYVKDSVGAAADEVFWISQSCYVAITYVAVAASCGKDDGSVTINANYGTPPYTYTIDGVTYQSSNVFTGVRPGYYSITVSDSHGETYSKQVTVYDKCPVTAATETDETCGQHDGVITASGTNGTKPYQFSINGTIFQTDSVFAGLTSGTYTVTLKDANGFEDSIAITINNNCLKVSATSTNEACGQRNGSITATGSGGTLPYEYSINGTSFTGTSIFTGLDSGTYTVTIQDAASLKSTVTVLISNKPAPVINLGNDTTLCPGQALTLKVNLTDNNITYNWQDGSSANNFTVTQPGSYWVNVNDSGCLAADTIQVSYLNLSNKIFTTRDTSLCKGSSLLLDAGNSGATYVWDDNTSKQTKTVDSTGTYWVRVTTDGCTESDTITCNFLTGPTITLPIDTAFCSGQQLVLHAGSNKASYTWENAVTSDSLVVTKGGRYWVAGTANGCTNYDTVLVTENPVPTVFIGSDTTICAGETVQFNAPTGAQYQYLWQDNSTGNAFTATSAGNYWLKVTNQYGCFMADTVLVKFRPLPVFSLGADTALCNGQVLSLKITIPGATYLWNTGSTSPSLIISTAGRYWLNISDSGCAKRDTINVSFKPLPVIALGNDTTLCTGQTFALNVANSSATYLWQDGSTQPTYTVTQKGVYSVTVTLNGCDTTGKIIVGYSAKPVINLGNDTTLCIQDLLVLHATYPQTLYLWQDGSTQPDYTVTKAGTYLVQATNGCGMVIDSVTIQFENCACKFYMPTAFTPNGDGKNDLFKPTYKCIFKQYQLRVFNRFGQNIFNTQNVDIGWDGALNGVPQTPGTYVWEIEYFDTLTAKLIRKNGTVVLVR